MALFRSNSKTTTTDGPLPASGGTPGFSIHPTGESADDPRAVLRRVTVMHFFAMLIVVAVLVFNLVTNIIAVAVTRTKLADLEERVNTLQKTEHYRGKDANGNEVWAADITVVPLTPAVESPAP